jgi:RNA polymerase sigma factor (sigma-70 family)
MNRLRSGDLDAIAELYRAFARPLYARILLPQLGDTDAAEEALAETFRIALERLNQYQDRGVSVWFWLARIAGNKAMDMHREKGRTGRALANFDKLLAPLRLTMPSPAVLIELQLELEELRRLIAATLERINPRYRRAIELRLMEEQPRERCAVALEVTVPTFDVVLLRALRAFRKEWSALARERQGGATP